MELETWQAPPGDTIPNHPGFPVLVYRGTGMRDPMTARSRFAEHGWGGSWVDGVFDYHHFHSTSHEVLAVVAGRATLELGGPQGETFEVAAGDVVVLPAGTGHRRAGADGSFTVVGAYPAGQERLRPAARRRSGRGRGRPRADRGAGRAAPGPGRRRGRRRLAPGRTTLTF